MVDFTLHQVNIFCFKLCVLQLQFNPSSCCKQNTNTTLPSIIHVVSQLQWSFVVGPAGLCSGCVTLTSIFGRECIIFRSKECFCLLVVLFNTPQVWKFFTLFPASGSDLRTYVNYGAQFWDYFCCTGCCCCLLYSSNVIIQFCAVN